MLPSGAQFKYTRKDEDADPTQASVVIDHSQLIARFNDPEIDIEVVRTHETLRNRTAYQLFLILKMESIEKLPSSDGGAFDASLTRLEKR